MSQYGMQGLSIGVTVTNTVDAYRYFHEPYFVLSKPIMGNNDTFKLFNDLYNVSFPKRMEYGEQYQVNYNLKVGFLDEMKKLKGQDVTITALVNTTVGRKIRFKIPMSIDDLFKFKRGD